MNLVKFEKWNRNPLYFRIYADVETDNEIGNSSICIQTAENYKQNQV